MICIFNLLKNSQRFSFSYSKEYENVRIFGFLKRFSARENLIPNNLPHLKIDSQIDSHKSLKKDSQTRENLLGSRENLFGNKISNLKNEGKSL